jgi:hypothetical protein
MDLNRRQFIGERRERHWAVLHINVILAHTKSNRNCSFSRINRSASYKHTCADNRHDASPISLLIACELTIYKFNCIASARRLSARYTRSRPKMRNSDRQYHSQSRNPSYSLANSARNVQSQSGDSSKQKVTSLFNSVRAPIHCRVNTPEPVDDLNPVRILVDIRRATPQRNDTRCAMRDRCFRLPSFCLV